MNELDGLTTQQIKQYINDLTEIIKEIQAEWRIVGSNLKQSIVLANHEIDRRRMSNNDREIPVYLHDLLRAVLYPKAWPLWMNTEIGALQGRTPWECIDENDLQAVIDLLESYRDD